MTQHYHKIKYTGGWFSLFLLFPVCFWSIKSDDRSKQKTMIEVNYIQKDASYTIPVLKDIVVTYDTLTASPPDRKYEKIIFTDENEMRYEQINLLVYKMRLNKDTLNGIEVIFTDNCKFKDMIRIFNLLLYFPDTPFVCVNEHVYIFETLPPTYESSLFICGIRYEEIRKDTYSYLKDLFFEQAGFIMGKPVIFGVWLLLAVLSLEKNISKHRFCLINQ